jgi:succinate dehydrogenase/fumarate reductase cytochrome b subunit
MKASLDVIFFICMHIFLLSIVLDFVNNDDLKDVFNTKDKATNFLRILLWPLVIFLFYNRRKR